MNERPADADSDRPVDDAPPADRSPCSPPEPRWRPAAEPTCCGSGCDDCPF